MSLVRSFAMLFTCELIPLACDSFPFTCHMTKNYFLIRLDEHFRIKCFQSSKNYNTLNFKSWDMSFTTITMVKMCELLFIA